jgi:glycosyltransferase involved in cell wall biosynthesis
VTTIHDVSYLEVRHFFSMARAAQLQLTVARTVRRAARIIAPSEFSRTRIQQGLQHRRQPDFRNPQRRRPSVPNDPRDTAAARIRDNHQINAPYILSVGDLHPRKNQTGLIRAFSNIVRADSRLPHHLVLVAKKVGTAEKSAKKPKVWEC